MSNIYLEVAKKVPVEKINEYLVFSGYQPLDPKKINAQQVAKALSYIVQSKGLDYYQALMNMYEENTKPQTPFKTDVIEVLEEKKSSCKCGGCGGCGSKKFNAEGEPSSTVNSDNAISKFIEKNSTMLILALTALGIAALLKKN